MFRPICRCRRLIRRWIGRGVGGVALLLFGSSLFVGAARWSVALEREKCTDAVGRRRELEIRNVLLLSPD